MTQLIDEESHLPVAQLLAYGLLTAREIGNQKLMVQRQGRSHNGTPMNKIYRNPARIGAPAPDLQLPTETGEIFSLSSLIGKPILISFLSHAA